MPTFNNSSTINFTQSDYTSARPSIGTNDAYDKSMRFANKTVTLDLGSTDYGITVFQVTYTGTLDYVSVGFFDPNGGFVSISQTEDGLYRPVKTSLILDEYKLKNDDFVNTSNVFYVIVNVEDTVKSNILNVCVSMGKRGTPPTTSSATISYNCPTPLYEYSTGLHVYSPYDAIDSTAKLRTKLYSKVPIESWTDNTPIYAAKGFNNPALPYYYGYGSNVYKVGGIFDRSYGTQTEVTVTKKLFRSPKTTYETFGPRMWFDSGAQTSDACTMPFIEGVGRLRSITSVSSLSKPEQYRYYMGYHSTDIKTSNDSVFTKYTMSNGQHNPVVGSTHALSKLLLGVAKGYDRSWDANDWAQGATILGLALIGPIGSAISTSAIGTTISAWFAGGIGPFSPWGITLFSNVGQWISAALVNPWVLGAIVLIALLVIIFGKKTKRYREDCRQFLHHFTDGPYIEVSNESHDTVLYRNPTLTTINNGYYCDGVYYYTQTGNKIVSKELSFTNAMINEDPLKFQFQYSIKADEPTTVTDYNSLIVLSYTSGKPLPYCGTGIVYYNNNNLTHNVTPNCCDLETATSTTITVENGSEFSCVSQQDANNKALAVFNAAVDYAENYANYCQVIADEEIGELDVNFTHELKVENTPTRATLFYDDRDNGGATIGKSLYFDASGCQKVLNGYYGVTGTTTYCTFYHTTNGVIDGIYYMSSSNSTTTTTGEQIVTTNLDYSSNWFLTNANAMTLTYLTNGYDNDMSFDPNSLYTDGNLKKGFINNLETLDDFQVYNNFNTTSHSQANTGWYRPLIDWIGNKPFYYYKEQTITLNVEERCGSLFNRGFYINSVLDGVPTTTTNPISMVVKVYTENVGLSGTYNVKTSNNSPSTFVQYGNQISGGEVVTGITINSITTPNPFNKTTYAIGTSTTCYTPPPSSCYLTIVSTETVDVSGGTLGSATITFAGSNGQTSYSLNGVSKGSCSSPFVITGLSANTEYTVIISDSSECTDDVTFTLGTSIFTFDADYMMLTYEFTDGDDLDTRTRIVTPFVGQDTPIEYIGWSYKSQWPMSGTPYLTWGGDNTGTGFESVLVNLNVFKTAYPSSTELVMDLRGFWFGTVGNNNVNVAATLWKGGTPTKSGFVWVNSTATGTYNIDSVGKKITSQSSTSGQRIATLTYNLTTGSGLLNNNDTTTPTV
jgi:hypothetical protein